MKYVTARTTNGGNTWSVDTLPFNGKLGEMTSLTAIDDTTAWVSHVESLGM